MEQLDLLKTFLLKYTASGIGVAYSGGVDSSLLLTVLKLLQNEHPFSLQALTMHSIFQSEEELREIEAGALEAEVELKVLHFDPLDIPAVRNNLADRCYWCKHQIFSALRNYASGAGLAILMDGTNADDLHSYRPGREAALELEVVSPFAMLGIGKTDVRRMAEYLGVKSAFKPSTPCMATRFEYGTLLSGELIDKVIAGEKLVRNFLPEPADIRLRVHGDIARLEVSRTLIPKAATHYEEISAGLRKLGFQFVTLDLEGFRSGSMDYMQNSLKEV